MTGLPRLRAAGALALILVALGAASARAGTLTGTAPDFDRPALDGTRIHLAAYRRDAAHPGKVVLLNFWASWCGPCLEEMPRLAAWQRRYGAAGLQILGVSMDDDPDAVRKVLERQPATYPILMGDSALGRTFGGILGLPLSYLIDTDGRIVASVQGTADVAGLERRIRALVAPASRR